MKTIVITTTRTYYISQLKNGKIFISFQDKNKTYGDFFPADSELSIKSLDLHPWKSYEKDTVQ